MHRVFPLVRERVQHRDTRIGESTKGTWWMPTHQMAMKDVANCDKPR